MRQNKYYGDRVVDPVEEYESGWNANAIDALERAINHRDENRRKTLESETEERKQRKTAFHDMKNRANAEKESLETSLKEDSQTLVSAILADAEIKGVKGALTNLANFLSEFRKDSDDYDRALVQTGANGRNVSKFILLFEELAKKNPEFLLYAPNEIFEKNIASTMSKADKALLKQLQTKLEQAKYFETNKIHARNLKFFPDYIGKITDQTDAVHALSIDPTKFNNLNPIVVQNLNTNTNLLADLITRVPQVFGYLTDEQIERVYIFKHSSVGCSIYNYPQNLQHLKPDFFAKHSPKFVFTTYTKAKLLDRFKEEDISRFPELAAHLGINVDGGYGV